MLALTPALGSPGSHGEEPEPFFVDRAAESGLEFVHFNGMTGKFYFPEMTGQGGALLDYDNDGDLDVYLVQGGMLGGDALEDAWYPPVAGREPVDRLFRNDGTVGADGLLRPRFVDVTLSSGIRAAGYGMGIAVGDVDDDGAVDLYVTNYGPNQLLLNNGDGTFRDATAGSGTGDELWGTSAALFDYDADGRLDLYVVNYVEFDVERNPACYATSSRPDYCGPSAFPPQPDRFYRNLGAGRFEEVTLRLLRDYRPGPGLGIAVADLDADGRLDLYVANDGSVNQLWIQRPDGAFSDEALLAGVAVNRAGRAEASMGVDAVDFDLDGDLDLFMTHLMGESNTLYVNEGMGLFEDRTVEAGLAAGSLPYTSFGTGWLDFDNDGLADLLILNGAVRILEDQASAGERYPLKQPNQLYRNLGGRFEEVTARAGAVFGEPEVSRGAAFGDVDNDGGLDVAVFNNNGPVRLLMNRAAAGSAWLGAAVLARPSGRAALGARVAVERAGRPPLVRRARTDGSYCSAHDARVLLGLGEASAVSALEVEWPGGGRRRIEEPPAGRYLVLIGDSAREAAP